MRRTTMTTARVQRDTIKAGRKPTASKTCGTKRPPSPASRKAGSKAPTRAQCVNVLAKLKPSQARRDLMASLIVATLESRGVKRDDPRFPELYVAETKRLNAELKEAGGKRGK